MILISPTLSQKEKQKIHHQISQWLALDLSLIEKCGGRIPSTLFCRELLSQEQKICDVYNGLRFADDSFPNRPGEEIIRALVFASMSSFHTGILQILSEKLNISSETPYHLINLDIYGQFKAHPSDQTPGLFTRQIGAKDDLRTAFALNENLKVLIAHGLHDLDTPYFASKRIVSQMKLSDKLKSQIKLCSFPGGHTFYLYKKSRYEWGRVVRDFVSKANSYTKPV